MTKHVAKELQSISAPLTDDERLRKVLHIADLIQQSALKEVQFRERAQLQRLSRMMTDLKGKSFTQALTDQSFRSPSVERTVNQVLHLVKEYGLPKFLLWQDRIKWYGFRFACLLSKKKAGQELLHNLRSEASSVILAGEKEPLTAHIQKRLSQGISVNINRIGEAVLGEEEAKSRLSLYLNDLQNPLIDYISVKISNLYSQISLPAWQQSKTAIKERLSQLYAGALAHRCLKTGTPKFVNLDMEEYRDLQLTLESFMEVLDKESFLPLSAGIVLQSYLPDSFVLQQQLTEWASQRVARGGQPIKIRLVKGANLMMERVESSLMGWPQAPYASKAATDANFKRMLFYGLDHLDSVHLGIGSHNLFDIVLTLILCQERRIDKHVTFEMLEGMSPHTRRVIKKIAPNLLLYCPTSSKHDFHNAITYLTRRLDENTGEENFLRQALTLTPSKKAWKQQAEAFKSAYAKRNDTFIGHRKSQNRLSDSPFCTAPGSFKNCPNTDWSLSQNRKWANNIYQTWYDKEFDLLPISTGQELHTNPSESTFGFDPSRPERAHRYQYTLASSEKINQAIQTAKEYSPSWMERFFSGEITPILRAVAQEVSKERGNLIGACILDGGKTLSEADGEVSEAIDFINYYCDQIEKIKGEDYPGIHLTPKGCTLVASPWNFPCAIPIGGISSALLTGNCVLFKPAPEATLVGWQLVNCFWRAGVPMEALQFIPCREDPEGSALIQDKRISQVILTGGTNTALNFLSMRPSLDLHAETGGKNALIISDLADKDLAIKDLIHSAFGHAGQKCSAASLGVLLKEVYRDPSFFKQLKDAAQSLHVGSAWDPATKVSPLIVPPHGKLLRALTELEKGESWLVEPKQDPKNPRLWSPGIKYGIKERSPAHLIEFFGPLLSLREANNLKEAIQFVNQTSYGLTSGLHSLDRREQEVWKKEIQAGNCYINREITGAIVQRQPFGGWKNSSFGTGFKAGGPHYLMQLAKIEQTSLPPTQTPSHHSLTIFSGYAEKILSKADFIIFKSSLENYLHAWAKLSQDQDPSLILGQDNLLQVKPLSSLCLRIQDQKNLLDTFRVLSIVLLLKIPATITLCPTLNLLSKLKSIPQVALLGPVEQFQKDFLNRLADGQYSSVRLLSPPSSEIYQAASIKGTRIISTPILATGAVELLYYTKERSLSVNYHRYGNLGLREREKRAPLCPSCSPD